MVLALFQSWLTPAGLFVILNIVIGTIAVTSRGFRHHQHDGGGVTPSKLFMDRVRSIGLERFGSGKIHAHDGHPEERPSVLTRLRSVSLYRFRSVEIAEESTDPGNLARAPSIVDCVFHFGSGVFNADAQQHTEVEPPSAVLERAPSVLERLRSIGFRRLGSNDIQLESSPEETADPPKLARAPSLLDRIYSIGIHRGRSSEIPATARYETPDDHAALLGRSQSEPREKSKGKESATSMPSSSMSADGDDGGEAEGDGVDARADDFINRFRQQLKLQRLDSIMRYTEMLNGGNGNGK